MKLSFVLRPPETPRSSFLGLNSPRDLGNLYFHALGCIIPSITYETFGMINIEAFARKTPVIVRDLGALPEVVTEAQGGYVYQTDSQLVAAVNQLIDSRATRDDIRAKMVIVHSWRNGRAMPT